MKQITLEQYCKAGNSVLKSFDRKLLKQIGYDCNIPLKSLSGDLTGISWRFWVDAHKLLKNQGVPNKLDYKYGSTKKLMNKNFPTIESWTTFLKYLIKTKIINESLT